MATKLTLALATLVLVVLVLACGTESPTGNASSKSRKAGEQPTPTASAPSAELTVRVTEPADKETVDWRPTVHGTVSNPSATVWVIVHPMNSAYWVQPSVGIGGDGKWRVQVYVGRAPDADQDVHFEIMAIAQPKANLKEGDVVGSWPAAEAKSQVIEVIRK